ncbi:MAG: cyclic nucleotide-binding domain-containing protein [Mariprofundaceae bacterium]|nr:cyclic nucleotide-binding domain-containing protein [Mariprofundaceae bacterium]
MPVIRNRKKAKDAMQRGDFFAAAHALAELCKLQPDDLKVALLYADISEQCGVMKDEAIDAYARAAHLCVDHHNWADGTKAMEHYYRLRPDGLMLGRELYRLARSEHATLAQAVPFLHEEDAAAFAVREHPMLTGISDAAFDELFAALQPAKFHDGKAVFRQGDFADYLCIIAKGAVQPWVESDGESPQAMLVTEAGGISGETPFLTKGKQRTADLLAVGNTLIYQLPYQALQQVIDRYPEVSSYIEAYHQDHAAERQLAKTPFFHQLKLDERRKIAQQMELITVTAGETLFRIGERDNLDMYIVHAGWLSVNVEVKGRLHLLYTAKRGNILGELGLRNNQRTMTVRSISDVQLFRWPERQYRDYYLSHEWLRFKLADRILNLNKKTLNLG